MTVFRELKRRNVFKVATAYLITAWLIIQIVAVLEPYLKLPEWVTPVIIVFLVVGFPIACLFAWAFELTPQGIMRSKDVVVDDSITNITGRKLDFGIIAAMAIALIFLTNEAYFTEDISNIATVNSNGTADDSAAYQSPSIALSDQVTSIAVLPFVNMSNDPEQEYFSDGLSEELLNVLARIKQLKVAARTSSFFFKNKNMDIKEIADKLDVEHVLEGSVRKSGTKLRVTAQLIQADTGYHLWSETYDYEIDDVFKIQDEISASVVQQLKITLLKEQIVALTEHGTRIPQAQDAYLLGRYFMRARTPESLEKSVNAFKKSLIIDPDNQLAISGLVDTLSLQEAHANLSKKDFLKHSLSLLTPFFDGANNSAEIDTSIGAYYESKGEKANAIRSYEKAIATNPNYAQAYHWYAVVYVTDFLNMTKTEKAKVKTLYKQALSLDPVSEILLTNLYFQERIDGRLIESENYLAMMLDVNPHSSFIADTALLHYWLTGLDWHKAWKISQNNSIENSGRILSSKIGFYLTLNMVEQAESTLKILLNSKAKTSTIAYTQLSIGLYKLNHEMITKAELVQLLKDFVKENNTLDSQYLLATAQIEEGEYELASDLLLEHYPQLLNKELLNSQYISEALLLYSALIQHDTKSAEIIAQKIELSMSTAMKRDPEPTTVGLGIPLTYACLGNKEKTLSTLAKLYEKNNYFDEIHVLQQNYCFDFLKEDIEFNRILKIAEYKLDEKRKQFLEQINEANISTL
ncbi:tetratricopeptide repeat protein [Thalassotalea sp. ND16A]|uniref:tetratricopeptide repeat protein n=1 Tax=Thalassotalea sp. ND16A TaxID=1535422 RepID=UPI00051D9ABB|nr:tetratricopeptide repeat protein [Thalassotalea sp. ND16A]KGJ99354.1 Adenylate cyclase [Thalassotalea sp. ND16A]